MSVVYILLYSDRADEVLFLYVMFVSCQPWVMLHPPHIPQLWQLWATVYTYVLESLSPSDQYA